MKKNELPSITTNELNIVTGGESDFALAHRFGYSTQWMVDRWGASTAGKIIDVNLGAFRK